MLPAHLDHKDQALQLFRQAEDLASSLKEAPLLGRIQEARERFTAERLQVVVCGEFKRGKSSLINALLEEIDLCLVDADITTALVTIIQYGPKPKYTIVLGESEQKAQEIRRDQIADYVTEQKNPHNMRQARLLLVELPNPRLREGLVLVDTPGVGGLNTRHTDVSYAFIPKADVVLFVMDPTPLSAPELDFVKRIDRHCKNVLFVVTRMDGDAGRKSTAVLQENRRLLGDALGRQADSVVLLPTSSRTYLDYVQSRDEQDLVDSGYPALERELWRLLGANRGRVLLASALVKLARALQDMREPLAAELAATEQESRQKAESIERDYRQALEQMGRLQESQAQWRTHLHDALEDIAARARGALAAGFRTIERLAREYLQDGSYLDQPQRLASVLETEIDAVVIEVQDGMEREAAQLHGVLEEETGLQLQIASVGQLRFPLVEARLVETQSARSSLWQKTLTVGRETMFSGGAGATVGGILFGLLGGAATVLTGGLALLPALGAAFSWGVTGGVLGLVAGKASGLRSSLRRLPEIDHNAMRQRIMPSILAFVEDNKHVAFDSLGSAQRELQRAMRDELDQRLRDEKRKAEEALQRMREAKSRPPSETAVRLPVLKKALKQLDGLHAGVVKLGIELTQGPGAGAGGEVEPRPRREQGEGDRGDWADA